MNVSLIAAWVLANFKVRASSIMLSIQEHLKLYYCLECKYKLQANYISLIFQIMYLHFFFGSSEPTGKRAVIQEMLHECLSQDGEKVGGTHR